MTAVAQAHPNIALIKYWGKADDELILPAASSLSLTLDVFATTTSVTMTEDAGDTVIANGSAAGEEFARRVSAFLDLVRERAGQTARAKVVTRNTVPTAAGLASSAAGFAALAVAASAAYGLDLDTRQLSRLARRGSGSATRSVVDGLALWHAGSDETSYAEPVAGPDLAMVVAVVATSSKETSSRTAMRLTAETSPYYREWISSCKADLDEMVEALAGDDFTRIGEVTESNALRMHAAIAASRPPIRFLAPESIRVFDAVARLRRDGHEVYATADAGPNVVVLTRAGELEATLALLGQALPGMTLIAAKAGSGARLVGDREASEALGEVNA